MDTDIDNIVSRPSPMAMNSEGGDNMMAEMRSEMTRGMKGFLGFFYFIQICINVGSVVAVINWANEDTEETAFALALVFCILLWATTICAGMWFWKQNVKTLSYFRPMWWTLLTVSVVDLIMVGGE